MSNLSEITKVPELLNLHQSLLVIGDSIALGAAEVRGSQVLEYVQPTCIDLLKAAMPSLEVTVDGEVSRTSASVRVEIDKLIERHQPKRALLMVGGSDADLDWRRFVVTNGEVARSRVPVEKYESNLRLICDKLIAAGATPILMDMPNHHFVLRGPYVSKLAGKDIMPMLERGGGQAESDRHLVLYRAAVSRVANDLGLQLVKFGKALEAYPAEAMLTHDGTHPSAAAHRVIAATIIAVLTQPFSASAEMTA